MCKDNFGATWDPFGSHRSRKNRIRKREEARANELTPEMQAELDAELAANERIAQTRRRRSSGSLFGAGSSVLGSPAVTSGAGSAMGRGGTYGGGGGGGGRGGSHR